MAAVIERGGRILIARRPPGTHLAGLWEFPGGKLQPGETLEQALEREIDEELGARAHVGALLDTVEWAYPDKRVKLHFFRCVVSGEPRPLEGQEIAWVSREELAAYPFPPADAAVIARLARP